MVTATAFQDRTVGVFGLGRSGLATARALSAGGAHVLAADDAPERRHAAEAAGFDIVDLTRADWSAIDGLVLSPGVPLTHPAPHPVAAAARAAGVEILGDIELLGRAMPAARYVGITGTNGKSTTTALIGHLLTRAGLRVEVGGNLGVPALDLAPLAEGETYVLEMSSYQLDLISRLRFSIAVLLNISPDHLDRHGGMDGYIAAKKRIFARQGGQDVAVVGVDDALSAEVCRELARAGVQRVLPISGCTPQTGGVFVEGRTLIDAMDGDPRPVADLSAIVTLAGVHNAQNAAAAYAVARLLDIEPVSIAAALVDYPGLAHRQELIAEVGGVRFINDSKATNPEAAARALSCYDDIYWIAGGRAKSRDLGPVAEALDPVAHVFLIGEAADDMAVALAGRVPVTPCGDLDTAVAKAARLARRERRDRPVVLLSPACASFDQFSDFEARGEAFRAAVLGLRGGA